MLNYAPRHEEVLESGGIAPHILNLGPVELRGIHSDHFVDRLIQKYLVPF
jgi:hypothetical protein